MIDWALNLDKMDAVICIYLILVVVSLAASASVFKGRDHDERWTDLCKRTGVCQYAKDIGALMEGRCNPGTCMMDRIAKEDRAKK